MNKGLIAGMPLAFAAGLVAMVYLQYSGIIQISPTLPQARDSSGPLVDSTNTLTDASRSDDAFDDTSLQNQIKQLQQNVALATQDRESFRSELFALRRDLADQSFEEPFLPTGESAALPDSPAGGGNMSPRGRDRFRGLNSNDQYAGLIAAGIDPVVASDIKQRQDHWELSRLELLDTAEREGWRRSEQFDEQMRELREHRVNVREELGDDSYDSYLYLSGENNRVRVDSIITDSAAQVAGVEQNDVVLSYASQRIFNFRQLQRATREGFRDEVVPIVVRRSGRYITLDVERGPLGVTLSGYRDEPVVQ